jgi:hypothetical protein
MKAVIKCQISGVFALALMCLYSSSGSAAGKFDFNDGTTQGWTLDQMYITSSQVKFTPVIGYSLGNSNNQLTASTGSLLIGKSEQNDIYLESPDLSANSEWQNITGYSVSVRRSLYSPCWGDFSNTFYFQLQIKVIDTADGNQEKLFGEYSGASFVFHDITTKDQLYQFTWKPSWLTDPRYKVKRIRFRITEPGDVMAECWYRGGWQIDDVTATTGSPSGNTGTGANVQVDLGSGVTVTYDNVSAAGQTSMTSSSSGTPPPDGFTIIPSASPVYYSITSTAAFTGQVHVCIQYNDAGMSPQQEASLQLNVYETPPGQWNNITSSMNTTTNMICGTVSHLSEFAVMVPTGEPSDEWVLTNDPVYGTIGCFAVMNNSIFAGTEGSGVFLSMNNGDSWNAANIGLTNLRVRALCVSGDHVFAGTWGGGVFHSVNNGASWTAVNTGLTDLSVATLYTDGTNLLAGTWGGGVFLSTNQGTNWTAVNSGITETHIRSLYIYGSNFFAGSIDGLYRSINGGASWSEIHTGLTNTAAISLAGIPGNGGEIIFAGTDGGGIFRSEDYGNEWTEVSSGLSNLHIPFLCARGVTLYAATWGGGLFVSDNHGAEWMDITGSINDSYIRSIDVSATYVFAGTENGGIWRKPLPPVPFIVIDGWKDGFYENLTGPGDGYLQLRSYAFNENGKPDNDVDLSAKIWMAWDEEWFYLYEEVMDDTLAAPATAAWDEDCVELKFDPQPTDSINNSVWGTRFTALDMNSPGVIKAENLVGIPDDLKKWARRQIPGGYVLEFAVAWSAIQYGPETITPATGNIFGMAINQHDNDGKPHRQASVQWAAVLKDAVSNTPKYLGTVHFLSGNKLEFVPENAMTGKSNPVPYDGSDYNPTGIEAENILPAEYGLDQNYPNPFNPVTTIRFMVKEPCRVELKVFDIRGREVAVPADEMFAAGSHSIHFDASGLPTGVYLYKIKMGNFSGMRKMVVFK